jgi:hypothetical protein
MKYYKAIEEGTTDVNGAWKPLKPLSEGFEFVGEDQEYDNLIGRRAKERRDVRKQGRASGLTRKEARKEAKNKIPTNKPKFFYEKETLITVFFECLIKLNQQRLLRF